MIRNKIANILSDDDIDSKYEKEIIEYGLEIIFLKLVFLVSAMTIGIFMNEVYQVIVFLIVFIPIRTVVGGYHAKTRVKCFFESNIMILVVLNLTRFFYLNRDYQYLLYAITVINLAFILIFAPIENKNKILSEEQKQLIKRKIFIYVSITVALVIFMSIFGMNEYLNVIMIAIISSGILGAIGKFDFQ